MNQLTIQRQAARREQLTIHCDEHTDKLLGTHCLWRVSRGFRKKVPLELGLGGVFAKREPKLNSPIDTLVIEARLKKVFSEQIFWA